jgi:N6-adenosine-specific RNA methylase IME4
MFAPFPPGPFGLVYADPPWWWRPRSAKGDGRRPPYGRVDLEDLYGLPLPGIVAEDAALALWTIDSLVPLMPALAAAWGFPRYSSVCFTWAKTTKHGKWHFGGGKTTRRNPEMCLLFARGKKGLPIRDHAVRQLIVAPVREHSRKPDEARFGLERLFGEVSRIELFARERVPGWTAWGLEAPPLGALAP